MEIRDVSVVLKRMAYFTNVLKPKYEKKFDHSLEGVCFWDPLHIEQYPEEVEAAIAELETAIKENKILLDEDGEPLAPASEHVIY
ncbi:hypothetical protein [Ligilactobacillus murinus]|uniref:Uncharacterized protein n=1 Tax=Ligilactobacillus murinus TaxID=1622 RepID=A0AAD0KX53_9LACO|nr:hypothetical protein [Ligilactobacillus murinus]AWZ37861.1 hypothetical protein CPS94_02455 [Ligilactobacillus murinus]AWZ41148.1 hypothetical protein CPQ89_09010 [Ligilactobacillus murinus]